MQMGLVLLVRILLLSVMQVPFSILLISSLYRAIGSKADNRLYSTPPTELLSFSVREVVRFDIIISFPVRGLS